MSGTFQSGHSASMWTVACRALRDLLPHSKELSDVKARPQLAALGSVARARFSWAVLPPALAGFTPHLGPAPAPTALFWGLSRRAGASDAAPSSDGVENRSRLRRDDGRLGAPQT